MKRSGFLLLKWSTKVKKIIKARKHDFKKGLNTEVPLFLSPYNFHPTLQTSPNLNN